MTTATDERTTIKVKVRHALVTWVEDSRTLMAFRGQVVDLARADAERLTALGAVVDPAQELERPGALLELPISPTDEELINWVLSASPGEIAALAAQRQELGPRLEGAMKHVVDERARQDRHLEAVREALAGIPPQELGVATDAIGTPLSGEDDDILIGRGSQPPTGGATDALVEPPTGGGEPDVPSTLGESSVADVVRGNVDDVSMFLAEHPEQAQAVLDAETQRAGGQPRAGVVRAVEVAASFTPSE